MAATTIVVVGAGPVGCATALRLARIPGVDVLLLEKRTLEELFRSGTSKRSYCMVLKERGTAAFEHLGLDLPSAHTELEGIGLLPSGNDIPNKLGHLVQRNLVALELLRAAAWEQGLRVQLGVGVVDVDFAAQALAVRTQAEWDVVADHSQAILDAWDARVPKARAGVNEASAAELRDPAPATARPTNEAGACSELRDQSLRFDLLVGADGAFSEVRRAAVRAEHIRLIDERQPKHKYKTFSDIRIPADADGLPKWLRPDVKPFERMYFATSIKANDWRAALWRPSVDRVAGKLSRVTTRCPETADELEASFPSAFPAWMRAEMAAQMEGQVANGYGAAVICSQLHAGDAAVLVGDAAHAMTISLGQGCNTGLESSIVLCDLLEQSLMSGALPLRGVPARYTKRRRAQAHAMQRIERMHAFKIGLVPAPSWLVRAHARVGIACAEALGAAAKRISPQLAHRLQFFTALADKNTTQTSVLHTIDGMRWAVYGAAVAGVGALVVLGAKQAAA